LIKGSSIFGAVYKVEDNLVSFEADNGVRGEALIDGCVNYDKD
jgi:hypothetical protein